MIQRHLAAALLAAVPLATGSGCDRGPAEPEPAAFVAAATAEPASCPECVFGPVIAQRDVGIPDVLWEAVPGSYELVVRPLQNGGSIRIVLNGETVLEVSGTRQAIVEPVTLAELNFLSWEISGGKGLRFEIVVRSAS